MPKCAIFLDRDGTLIEDAPYLHRLQDISIYPRALEAVRKINQSGLLAIVITNQSAVARGLLTEDRLQKLHQVLADRFCEKGARLDAFYYCPHHPEGNGPYRRVCRCRKPEPGLLRQAVEDFQIELSNSYLIGDRLLDVQTAARAGCGSVLVKTGYGASELNSLPEAKPDIHPLYIAHDVLDGVNWILRQSPRSKP